MSPEAVYESLRRQLNICIEECMKSLVFQTLLLYSPDSAAAIVN